MPAPASCPLVADDGCALEAELAVATDERAGMVLCHPHPLYGGTMRSLVISALFDALPAAGVTCLRFNFRGVEGSAGTHDEGRGERLDAAAAVDVLADRLAPGTPLVLTGWSFGADVALATLVPAVRGWLAIAPPLHYVGGDAPVGADERPKLVVLAEHDKVRSPAEVEASVASWRATDVTVVGGASHFFVGRAERLVVLARGFVDTWWAEHGPVPDGPRGSAIMGGLWRPKRRPGRVRQAPRRCRPASVTSRPSTVCGPWPSSRSSRSTSGPGRCPAGSSASTPSSSSPGT
jgi:uncharacterized protein